MSYNFQLVSSHLAMSLGLWFCGSRKAGQAGGGGWVHSKDAKSKAAAASGLSHRKPLGRHWVGHFSPPLHKWALKTVLCPCRAPFLAVKHFSHSIGATIGQ